MSLSKYKQNVSATLDRLGEWRKQHIADTPFLFFMVVVIGLASGAGAFLLKHMIAKISRWITAGADAYTGDWMFFVFPALGIIITGFLTRCVMRQNLAHGSRQMRQRIRRGDYYMAPSRMFYPIIASSITLGFGGSAGSEGPIAATGGAIGANLGRWTRLSPDMVRLLIGCGAGAGIAGIFKAPIGGALFTLEIMQLPITTMGVLALFVCTIVSALTAYALGGFTLDLSMSAAGAPFDSSLMPFIIALGLVCGFYSLYYSFVMKHIGNWLNKLKNPWVTNIVAGTTLGAMVYFFPSLYGEGYGVVGSLLNGKVGTVLADSPFATAGGGVMLLIMVSLGIVLVKCFATSDTNNGGGVAGDFAPTLFAGAVLGFLFATALNEFWGFGVPVEMFVLFGMAGVMSGAIRAPLMAWMLVVEMVGSYTNFLPIFVVAIISYAVVRLFTADAFFDHRPDRMNGWLSRLHNIL